MRNSVDPRLVALEAAALRGETPRSRARGRRVEPLGISPRKELGHEGRCVEFRWRRRWLKRRVRDVATARDFCVVKEWLMIAGDFCRGQLLLDFLLCCVCGAISRFLFGAQLQCQVAASGNIGGLLRHS